MAAYRAKAGREGAWVSLADLRDGLGGSREQQDASLRKLIDARQLVLIPEENQKTLTGRDREAALLYGGEPNHLVRVEPNPSPRRKARPQTSDLDPF